MQSKLEFNHTVGQSRYTMQNSIKPYQSISRFGTLFILALILVQGSLHPDNTRRVSWQDLRGLDSKSGKATPLLRSLAGKEVSIPGFMIPLDDDGEKVGEFLLVPYPMACIHVPAPPSNQVVYVTMTDGAKVTPIWPEPVLVTGIFRIESASSIYASSSFILEGTKVVRFKGNYQSDYDSAPSQGFDPTL